MLYNIYILYKIKKNKKILVVIILMVQYAMHSKVCIL